MGFTRRQIKFALIRTLLLPPGKLLLRALLSTYRLSPEVHTGVQLLKAEPHAVIASCHGMLFALLGCSRAITSEGVYPVILSSPSRDSELLEIVLRSFKLRIVKGSSRSRAVAGARELIEEIRAGHPAILTVDGPRGPRLVPKAGFASIARAADAAVYTASLSADRCWRFRSWDRLFLPKPFSTITLSLKRFELTEEEDPEESRARLEQQLRAEALGIKSPVAEDLP